MGLTIAYELSLPGRMSKDEVLDIVTKLRAEATTLDFEMVSPVVRVERGDVVTDVPPEFAKLAGFFDFAASTVSEPHAKDDPYPIATSRTSTWSDAIGFVIIPGDRCEYACIGFTAPSPVHAPEWPAEAEVYPDWHWMWWCKTQYASAISAEHFLKCHRSLIELFDAAKRLDIGVTVHDEGGYWDNRDDATLLAEVGDMNCLIAAFAGDLSDALEPGAVEAEIFQHPEFERLEMEKPTRDRG
jgi:hypothetical protein